MNTAGEFPAPFGNSSPVEGNQSSPSERLPELVRRHLQTEWKKPIGAPTQELWKELCRWWSFAIAEGAPVILDSGCGTGESAAALREVHPTAVVIGADRSLVRLEAGIGNLERRQEVVWDALRSASPAGGDCPAAPPGGAKLKNGTGGADPLLRRSSDGRLLLARGELTDLWRLALAARLGAERHYLLYPNPSPLRAHLIRRWHGHPVFPKLPLLAPVTELRTNWKIYAEEFAEGWELLGEKRPEVEPWVPEIPLTPFERKYAASGHQLWRVVATSASCVPPLSPRQPLPSCKNGREPSAQSV